MEQQSASGVEMAGLSFATIVPDGGIARHAESLHD
jgi:hypothetical protein